MQESNIRLDEKNRRIIVGGEIDELFGVEFCEYFLDLENNSGIIEIILLSSVGGDWEITQGLIDLVTNSPNIIETYSIGTNSSSAAMLFLAGDYRYVSPSSKLMYHNGFINLSDTYTQVINYAEIAKKDMEWCFVYLSERSNKPPGYFKDKLSKNDFFVDAELAVELDLAKRIKLPNG